MTFPACPDCGAIEDGLEVFACENADCEHHEGLFCEKCAKATNANAGECPYCAEYGPQVGEVVADGSPRHGEDGVDGPDAEDDIAR